MSDQIYNVLFLCTGNSARSIFGEAILNHLGGGRFRGYSAGSYPKGTVHPLTLELLRHLEMPTEELRSKSWEEFAAPGAPVMDFIFTVCDQAAGEICPVWPGKPVTAHWGLPDPAAAPGTEAQKHHAFRDTFLNLERRISLFMSLRPEMLDATSLRNRLIEIHELHHSDGETARP
jgi:arsenate reductase